MPYILRDPEKRQASGNLSEVNYHYVYPDGLNLKPGTPLHEKLRNFVMEKADDSFRVMQRRFSSWRKIDNILTAYIPLSEQERIVKEQDSRKPVSIVVPYSYATMETILTYMLATFLQDPIFKYLGHGPEDTLGAMMLEKIVAKHCAMYKAGLALHVVLRDSLSYGIGVAVPSWEVRRGYKTIAKPSSFFGLMGELIQGKKQKSRIEAVLFEGNKLVTIDPYKFLPDPNVSIHRCQDGEYVGWVSDDNYLSLLAKENDEGELFNVKYVKHIDGRSKLFWNDESNREMNYNGRGDRRNLTNNANPVDVVHFYITLIPKDWELGSKETPEKWYFAIAGDEVIIDARPMDLDHNMYPVAIAAPDFDGYSVTPLSRIELTYGMQETLDWLFSSHISNVRKAINDMLIVDPYLVNIADIEDPQPGKIIRMRRAAWGRGVKDAVQQLAVTDITQGHIRDSQYIIELMNRVTAASDQSQGLMRSNSADVSATEARGTQTGYLSRLERMARVVGLQMMQDVGYMFAKHTQQFMSEESYVQISGEWPSVLQGNMDPSGRYKVSPFDILVDYDVVTHDGSMPSANFADMWVQLYQIMAQNPAVGMQFDMVRVFKHIATSLGAKNVNDFVAQGGQVNPQVMETEAVNREVERGNLIPIPGGGRGGA